MAATPVQDEDQTKRWNGSAGCAWVEAQQMLDRTLQPYEDLLVAEISASGARSVLDVGCGTGSTTRAAARLVGEQGAAVGIDISEQMIDAARMIAEQEHLPATFICDDAQKHEFGARQFDLIISRFGTMFFEDPLRAFANLRSAAASGAKLRSIVWRGPADNPFMTTAERAAAPLLPNLPPRVADAPGQFGLADARRTHSILKESGWDAIDIRQIDVTCTIPEQEITRYGTRFGPVGIALQRADPQTHTRVAAAVRAAFEPFVHGPEVRFIGACWMIAATSP